LTDIIYKQLDLFNSQLSNFKLKDIEKDNYGKHIEYNGRAAISLLRHRIESIITIEKDKIADPEKQKAMLRFMGEIFAFIEINKYEFQNIYEELDSQVNVIRAVLIKEDIPPSDLNELKSLFFRNIGRDFLNSSKHLGSFLETYITYKKEHGEEIDELFSPEHSIKSKISVIEEFRSKQYDKQTIQQYLRSRDLYNETSF
jgi:hypothetical protein